MLLTGAALGGLTLLGLGVTYKRLPKGVRAFVCRHPLITDVVVVVFFYEIMGMTLIAHVACATMVLGVQALLHIERNKEDYQFLYELIDRGKATMDDGIRRLREICREYSAPAKLNLVASK